MKLRFNNFDIQCAVKELQTLKGQRINQIYDVDNKTFLFRFQGADSKKTLLMESGIRFHLTSFEWPKNPTPSGFTMKLRKHLRNKRIENIQQLGTDRIVKFVFGSNEATYNVILELYDRGNIILTDFENTILYLLRPHIDGEDVRLVVREKYPENRAQQKSFLYNDTQINKILSEKKHRTLRSLMMTILDCGPAVIEHVLRINNLWDCYLDTDCKDNLVKKNKKNKNFEEKLSKPFDQEKDITTLLNAIAEAEKLSTDSENKISKGYIIQMREERVGNIENTVDYLYHNIEYHPFLFEQHKNMFYKKYNSFMEAVDEFYSNLEGQKIDMKTLQLEKEALKKLSNVKLDHEKRLDNLAKIQEADKIKADLITSNLNLVDAAINAIRQLVANQMSWANINQAVKSAQDNGDRIAQVIKRLKLESNIISLALKSKNDDECTSEIFNENNCITVDVDINNTAWANARQYYDKKRSAAQKEQKTIDASEKALKNAERKTHQTLKDVRTISSIAKSRKTFWFEKFYWFISSENYLVIGGRDAQQNELIVKRYMGPSDIYVHAEIQGASSVVIRNPNGGEVPPKTLVEAGTMAISYSVAWDAKVVTNAYWVKSDQVSKTAPSGEFLGTGSFMIRGKKNFLPPCQLIMGISMLFKLEDESIKQHIGERRVKHLDDFKPLPDANITINVQTKSSLNHEIADSTENENPTLDRINALEFPDTEIKVEHDITLPNQNLPLSTLNKGINELSEFTEEATLVCSVPTKKKQTIKSKKSTKEKSKNDKAKTENEQKTNFYSKRHNTNKERRKQNKYKDQDKEERDLRMQILKSAGKYDQSDGVTADSISEYTLAVSPSKCFTFGDKMKNNSNDECCDKEDLKLSADVDMLDSLTGQPFEDDELIFAIPVIAPYQALQNYKYKIKIIPGNGKRGTVSKTALQLFSKEKNISLREKDLLKSIKDEMMARNIPGKVKLMTSQFQKPKN